MCLGGIFGLLCRHTILDFYIGTMGFEVFGLLCRDTASNFIPVETHQTTTIINFFEDKSYSNIIVRGIIVRSCLSGN